MSLSADVHKFIEKEELFLESSALLCAVSGGRDSMVMLDILLKLGYKIQVAHINYMLRGYDSIEDQALIKRYCQEHNLTLHTKELTSVEVLDLEKGNLQEKARDIRYGWFDELLKTTACDVVCIAHHRGDVAETFMLHALRGAGINGLKSIQQASGFIRRPLLRTHPSEIDHYASEFNISFRHDASNFSDKYDRNYIRNHTVKSLQERWPSAIDKISDASANVSQELNLLNFLVKQEKSNWITSSEKEIKVGPIRKLKELAQCQVLTFHMIKEYGFNYDLVKQMLSPSSTQGAVFQGESHTGCLHDNHILIRKRSTKLIETHQIAEPQELDLPNGQLKISMTKQLQTSKTDQTKYIELKASRWPLQIRKWQEGDKIKPLGMNGKTKKVSDILIDQKASFFEKEEQLVLLDKDGEVIWLIGRKLSETVKYDERTSKYIRLEYSPYL